MRTLVMRTFSCVLPSFDTAIISLPITAGFSYRLNHFLVSRHDTFFFGDIWAGRVRGFTNRRSLRASFLLIDALKLYDIFRGGSGAGELIILGSAMMLDFSG